METLLDQYTEVVGRDVINQLLQLGDKLRGMKVVHVNSTREGGGVAEILNRLVPLMQELGLEVNWEVITTDNPDFYQCTKNFHNALQGDPVDVSDDLLAVYEETNRKNFDRLQGVLEEADVVFIHDPQPAPFLNMCPNRKGKWIWRCHIDVSRPYRPVWKYIRNHIVNYDASIWHLAAFAQRLNHPLYLIPPSIDPLSQKNVELEETFLDRVCMDFQLDRNRPIITQVSRFDRFKDPVGVIRAYRMAKNYIPLQLVLAGGEASDDPEGMIVLDEVRQAAADDPDIKVLCLPADAHKTINALQRVSDIVVQKSTKEGFGLTVTEGMWKGKPVIGGDVGGIRLQVVNHHTGFLVNTPEGAALRIRYLLRHREILSDMGAKAKRFVLENFLLTRHLREYLTIMVAITNKSKERIEL